MLDVVWMVVLTIGAAACGTAVVVAGYKMVEWGANAPEYWSEEPHPYRDAARRFVRVAAAVWGFVVAFAGAVGIIIAGMRIWAAK